MANFIPAELLVTIIIFYWAYLIIIGIYLIISFFCLYHLVRFGFFSAVNISIILGYMLLSLGLISYSLVILSGLDWSLPLFDSSWFNHLGGIINTAAFSPKLPTIKF